MDPVFAELRDGWLLAMDADGYAAGTRRSYQHALLNLSRWAADNAPGIGPTGLTRNHVRGWIVHLRATTSPNTARTWFAGARHFCRWMVAEKECTVDATEGIRTPSAGDPTTPVVKNQDIQAMIATCAGQDFVSRRDAAIIFILADGGLRLAEITNLKTLDIDIPDRTLFVLGKGTNRSGPRRRAVQLGVKAARALDRYLRERRKHPFREMPQLWLGGRNRQSLSAAGVEAMLKRRAALVGITVHAHQFRHTWASEFRAAGGEEGDLMVLGGWRSRQMLDRYGKVVAADRARAAYRRHSFGDRL